MDEEELAITKQFQHSSTLIDSGNNSGGEQGPAQEGDLEEDQQDKEDNLWNADQNDDVETDIFGGGESNGICVTLLSCFFYSVLSLFLVTDDG